MSKLFGVPRLFEHCGVQLLFERIKADIFMLIYDPASAGYCRLLNAPVSRICDI